MSISNAGEPVYLFLIHLTDLLDVEAQVQAESIIMTTAMIYQLEAHLDLGAGSLL